MVLAAAEPGGPPPQLLAPPVVSSVAPGAVDEAGLCSDEQPLCKLLVLGCSEGESEDESEGEPRHGELASTAQRDVKTRTPQPSDTDMGSTSSHASAVSRKRPITPATLLRSLEFLFGRPASHAEQATATARPARGVDTPKVTSPLHKLVRTSIGAAMSDGQDEDEDGDAFESF